MRTRHEKIGNCAECRQPMSKACLEAASGPGRIETAGNGRILEADTQTFTTIRADILVSIWCLFL